MCVEENIHQRKYSELRKVLKRWKTRNVKWRSQTSTIKTWLHYTLALLHLYFIIWSFNHVFPLLVKMGHCWKKKSQKLQFSLGNQTTIIFIREVDY